MKKKKCYSLTYIGPNGNGGSHFRINSTIYLQAPDGDISAPELRGYANYIQAEIARVWSTDSNPGLSAGAGTYRYNSTKDTFTCAPPTGVKSHPRDTGVVVSLNTIGLTRKGKKEQNQILIHVFRTPPPQSRAFMSPEEQFGQLYYLLANRDADPDDTLNYSLTNMNDPFIRDAYMNLHNTAAHEFGHAMGLRDRYHYLAFGHYSTNPSNGNLTQGTSSAQWITRHGGGDVPMYLPGLYDVRRSGYSTAQVTSNHPSGYNELAPNPTYSLPVYRDQTNTEIPNTSPLPQPDYNPDLVLDNTLINNLYGGNEPPSHRGAYDIEYSTLFGWEHNLMSKRIGINDPGGQSNNRFRGMYGPAIPADPRYDDIYKPEIDLGAAGPEVVLITKVQTDVITDTGGTSINLPGIGGEIISKRFEDKIAESRGFAKGLFDQYVFIVNRGTAQNGWINGEADDPNDPNGQNLTHEQIENRLLLKNLDLRGVSPSNRGIIVSNNNKTKEFYNTRSGGSFIGIHYTSDLDKDGKDEDGKEAIIVCDWKFDITNPLFQKVGITDCMDFRMSRVVSTNQNSDDYNRWEPEKWDYSPPPVPGSGGVSQGFLGFINPNIAARISPKSQTRRYITGKTAILNRIKNIELDNLGDSFFTGFPDNFIQLYNGGREEINVDILYFGTTDPVRYAQRIFEQYNNPNSRFIFDGKFDNSTVFNAVVGNDDLFKDCGIASEHARLLWNSTRNDYVPALRNPTNVSSPIPLVISGASTIKAGTNSPTYPFVVQFRDGSSTTVNVTSWEAISESAGQILYTLSYTEIPGNNMPADIKLKKVYKMRVKYFPNRNIIELMTLVS